MLDLLDHLWTSWVNFAEHSAMQIPILARNTTSTHDYVYLLTEIQG
ncbi:hypothetical protein I3842_09G093600 [Carya illinoinensis]|uniref:Uncharacterized protein n=1 Tax=Carya illinoinensis TaxID=32201 RepID=A0A922J7Y5_CARIL|nr:hypothetical protein I3842_09G093600 [Carya illinoinensis]